MTMPPAAAPGGTVRIASTFARARRREIDGVADDDRRDDLLRPALLARVIGGARRGRRQTRRARAMRNGKRDGRTCRDRVDVDRRAVSDTVARNASRKIIRHADLASADCRHRPRLVQGLARRARGLRGHRARPARACGPTPRSARARWPTAAKARSTPCCRAAGERQDDAASLAPAEAQRTAAYGIVDAPEGATAIIEAAEIVGITDPDGMARRRHRALDHGGRRNDPRAARRRRAPLHDRRRRQQHQRRRRGNAGGARTRASSTTPVATSRRHRAGLAQAPRASTRQASIRGFAESAITIMSDVNNPLCGERGATASSARRKACGPTTSRASMRRSRVMRRWSERAVGTNAARQPGAGAAGGLGFALQLVGGSFRSGAEVVADLIGLDAALEGATGRSPAKAAPTARRCCARRRSSSPSAPAPPVCRSRCSRARSMPRRCRSCRRVFSGCFALPSGPMTLADCIAGADALLADRAEQIARTWTAARG